MQQEYKFDCTTMHFLLVESYQSTLLLFFVFCFLFVLCANLSFASMFMYLFVEHVEKGLTGSHSTSRYFHIYTSLQYIVIYSNNSNLGSSSDLVYFIVWIRVAFCDVSCDRINLLLFCKCNSFIRDNSSLFPIIYINIDFKFNYICCLRAWVYYHCFLYVRY